MMIHRDPAYNNQRAEDCFVKMYIDENGIAKPDSWGIPKPNPEAAYKSLAKYAKGILPMDEDEVYDMNLAWSWTERHFGLYMQNSRVLTLDEAIRELDMSTSSGCPFNKKFPKKKELFEEDEEITAWLEEDWNLLGVDPDWTCVATNSLKEELRTKEKMNANSIRTFTSMPVDATIHGTRLFVDMNIKMYRSHLKTASAVGMSPYNGNWNVLYKKLNVFRNGYALDEKEYDSSLRAYLMWGCAQFRYKMLSKEFQIPENKLRIQTYYRNLINTLILTPEGIIIQKKTGNPSGSCNTISDNTLILYTLMAYAWIRTSKVENINLCTYEDFEMLTSKALVGDDNTWTVSDEAHEFYNGVSVIEVWKTLGVTTTTDSLEPREAEYLDFLSAQFLPMRGVMVPIYDREKIMNSVYYSPKKDHSPCVTLERTAALLGIGWTDLQIRKFCRELIAYLILNYDAVLREDPDWIRAKTQIQSDQVYESRFTGIACYPQSVDGNPDEDDPWISTFVNDFEDLTRWDEILSGKQERFIKPDKKVYNMSNTNKRQRRRGRGRATANKQQQRQQQQPRKPKFTPKTSSFQKPKRGARRGKRNTRAFDRGGYNGEKMSGFITNPRMEPRSEVYSFDERIATVNGNVTFAVLNTFALNPANSASFPWLSKIASLYERYKFEEVKICFQHDVSQFATQGTTGSLYLSALYDAASAAPTSAIQIADTDPRCFGMPNQDLCLTLSNSAMHPAGVPKFCRPGVLPGQSDIKEYDAGNVFFSATGCQNTSEVGFLQIKGRVRLITRLLDSSANQAPVNNSVSSFYQANVAGGATTVEQIVPIALLEGTNGLAVVNTAGSLVLPAGNYLFDWDVSEGASSTATLSDASAHMTKNGTGIKYAADDDSGLIDLSGTSYQTSNGTDVFTLRVTATYAAGALTLDASVRIVAI
jgi:hypothetical protein